MADRSKLEQCADIFRQYPEVKLAYAFGSQTDGTAGPMSDYDFAVYLDTREASAIFEIKPGCWMS
ncbi:MAG: hypothetical protein COT71_00125 [Candidatus Andersenbacteria bacterium CG10_big_fil_rev_8_21_14_0_10_54_11]|uniref:Polymerase beta nucleotidyltransferase domain-containing protein n=1 Tax=Candidatus Andersenbacteria bacterium CG10_big_fil_rev_8_21_14_0_10_54_11 TaxID=1974485 RepID=A0A2M6X0Q0_9BACT|nr:MAG: hypothetical protein COT71_00125 [Candidatus Andersenbacteria bacterium CG10_big_fil_rev_8_21_14_0_10_54_11]